jgi:DHA1 family bicyclomycin/chloramphenicol resistance-like MFS transporter
MNHRLLITLLASLSMIGALSIDAYLPALPAIAKNFGVSLPAAQQTLTVYLIAFAFMTLFYGTLSDSFGRRPVILTALSVYFCSSIGAGCTTSLAGLMFFRLLQGLSAASGSVIGRAIVGDLLKGAEAQRTLSFISIVFGLAPAIAPILGGWLQSAFGWRAVFIFIAIFAGLLLAACFKFLPESLPPDHRHAFHFKVIVGNYWEVVRHARFMFGAIGAAFAFFGILLYVASAPAFVINLMHLSVKDFGWLFLPLIGGLTLGAAIAGRLSHRVSPARTIQISYVIMILSVAANLAYTGLFPAVVPWAVVPLFFYGIGAAVSAPAMTILNLSIFPKVRGLASSLQGFFFMIIFSAGSGVISPLLFDSAFKLAAGAAIGLLLSLIFWSLSQRTSEETVMGEPLAVETQEMR